MSTENEVVKLHANDNVGIALRALRAGKAVRVGEAEFIVLEDIPAGHKISLTDIQQGGGIFKYGVPIGQAVVRIQRGQWVHSHNLQTNLSGKLEYQYQPEKPLVADMGGHNLPKYFAGYVRESGEVGIRNEIWIINTVGCINKTAEKLAEMANARFTGNGIDGVFHFSHPYGCSQLGDDLHYTQKLLAGLVRHPNAAGVLVLGLGCENNRISDFAPVIGEVLDQRVKFLTVQGVQNEFTAGMEILAELAAYAKTFQRTPVPISRLKIGLKCGGSDGFSGITANPLVGNVSDLLVQQGATTLLTEVPEMFGAETILMNRAKDGETFQKVVNLINDFKDYYSRHEQVIYDNPSPGNKDGGITTLEEKSLGCIQKGGTSPVMDVLSYAEKSVQNGLNLVQAPGNDMVSVTALAAAGAHLVLFTTGRGTPMGGVVPTVKVSTNTALCEKKPHWIDLDAGRLLSGLSIETMANELYQLTVNVASGKTTAQNENNGFREIAIFKDGVTL
ncbi:altronate dehydratase [Alicyclobacillaceae bacterium I2511]|nr:altronate dehydratase [Alicyclobacillaceae bacterium I2511]